MPTERDVRFAFGYSQRTRNFKRALKRVLDMSLIEMTIPENPNGRIQRQRITAKGLAPLTSITP